MRDARLAALATQHGVALAPQDPALALQQQHGDQQQRQGRGGRQPRFGRELEQAPDLGGDHVEARRQRQDGGRAEHGQRLQDAISEPASTPAAPAAT
jgi:hypothetical protein